MTDARSEPLIAAAEADAPERLLVVPVMDEGTEPHYLLVRWPDWPHPALLSIATPGLNDSIDEGVRDLLDSRLHVETAGPAQITTRRVPVRMPAPRMGLSAGTGWLRAVLVPVRGEPQPDSLLDGCELLALDAALAALPTEVERMLLRDAAAAGGITPNLL
jgi:hypothetical protein